MNFMKLCRRWIAVVVLSLVAAGGVMAQTTLWSATMTVGSTMIDGNEYTGYSGFTPDFGSLSDTDFRYGRASTGYTGSPLEPSIVAFN